MLKLWTRNLCGGDLVPARIHRERVKGWKKPNDAVVVSRPTKWGNPFKTGERITRDDERFHYAERALPGSSFPFQVAAATPLDSITVYSPQSVVDAYTWWLIEQPHLMASLDELRGRDLVCWCPLDQPCHADSLLELANLEAAVK